MTYRKYEFNDREQAEAMLQGETNTAFIGHIVLTAGVYDGLTCITPPILSEKFAVDVIHSGQPHPDLAAFEVWPANPKHFFAGMEQLYFNDLPK
jgi:hypothetical protein